MIALRSRRAHYVDIENLCGRGLPVPADIQLAMDRFGRATGGTHGERLTVACNHKVASAVGFTLGLSGAQLCRGSGRDGADHALLNVLIDDVVSGRVNRIVIGSGDGIFADALTPYADALEEIVFVACAGSMSTRCEALATRCFYLPAPVFSFAS